MLSVKKKINAFISVMGRYKTAEPVIVSQCLFYPKNSS